MYSINYYDCTYNMKFCQYGYSKKGSNIYCCYLLFLQSTLLAEINDIVTIWTDCST